MRLKHFCAVCGRQIFGGERASVWPEPPDGAKGAQPEGFEVCSSCMPSSELPRWEIFKDAQGFFLKKREAAEEISLKER